MKDWIKLRDKKKIVIKLGTSSLTYANGKLNFERVDRLSGVLSNLCNSGKQVILVSSGAIAVGTSKLNKSEKPKTLPEKQAYAAVGQAELMRIYQKYFSEYNQIVAQVLLTRDVVTDKIKNKNARNTLKTLLKMGIIPIINENDTVATHEIEHLGYGDNDRLSADVATLADADLLVILSDIDGLYSGDPNKDTEARIIKKVSEITPEIERIATGPNMEFAKGGMKTKIEAVKICFKSGIDVVITNGKESGVLYDIAQGKDVGTLFIAPKK